MTRAPRSASWRVAKGAAMACSSVTTVIPVRGLTFISSLDHCGGIHRQPAFVVFCPKMEGLAVSQRLAAHKEGIDVEGRPDGLEPVLNHLGVRALMAQE